MLLTCYKILFSQVENSITTTNEISKFRTETEKVISLSIISVFYLLKIHRSWSLSTFSSISRGDAVNINWNDITANLFPAIFSCPSNTVGLVVVSFQVHVDNANSRFCQKYWCMTRAFNRMYENFIETPRHGQLMVEKPLCSHINC